MDFFNSAMGQNTQNILGEQYRAAQKALANQATGQSTSTASTTNAAGSSDPTGMMPMFMMLMTMMMQMMGQTPGFGGTGATDPGGPSNLLPGLPPTQNPAWSSLEARFEQKAKASPTATTISFTVDDIAAVLTDLKAGVFTRAELGQALMHNLANGTDKNLPAIKQLIQELSDSGDINITAFLQEGYLKKLSTARKDTLLLALSAAGLTMSNANTSGAIGLTRYGKPNTRLIGLMLEVLGRPGSGGASKAFVKQLLKNLHDDYPKTQDDNNRKLLTQILALGGVFINETEELVFP